MKISKITLNVTNGTKFSINSINYDPQNIIDSDITWKSVMPEIVSIDMDEGVASAEKVGVAVICGISTKNEIKVYCTISVEEPTSKLSRAVGNNIVVTMQNYESDCTNVTALGYSGTAFSYTENMGNRVTLEYGLRSKNGEQDYNSSLFRSELIYMNAIFSAMSPIQKSAWYVLRLNAFIATVKSLVGVLNISTKDVVEGIASGILEAAGIDLGGMLGSTVLGVYNWYEAEERAISYYEDF